MGRAVFVPRLVTHGLVLGTYYTLYTMIEFLILRFYTEVWWILIINGLIVILSPVFVAYLNTKLAKLIWKEELRTSLLNELIDGLVLWSIVFIVSYPFGGLIVELLQQPFNAETLGVLLISAGAYVFVYGALGRAAIVAREIEPGGFEPSGNASRHANDVSR